MTAELWAVPALLLLLLAVGLIALVRGRSRPPPPMSRRDSGTRPMRQPGPQLPHQPFEPSLDGAPDTEPDNLHAQRDAAADALKQARLRAAADAARLEAMRQSRTGATPTVVTPLRRPATPAQRPPQAPGPLPQAPERTLPPAGQPRQVPPIQPPTQPPTQPPARRPDPRGTDAPASATPGAPRPPVTGVPPSAPPVAPHVKQSGAPAAPRPPAPSLASAAERPPRPAMAGPMPAAPARPVELPTPARSQPLPLAPSGPALVGTIGQAPITVLVVDDSKVVRVKTSRLLEKHHYRVLLADDGLTALQALSGQWPDLVITDVEMPGLDGFGLTQRLRALPHGAATPVIMITSSNERHRDEAERAGVNVLLGKPYPEEQLLAEMEKALGRVAQPAPAGQWLQ